jgi:hypothetical protein
MTKSPPDRITTNLKPKTITDLKTIAETTGENQTEIVNRAVNLYALLLAAQKNGGALYLKEKASADMERLRFL